jgi:DNA helicase IV
VVIEIRKLKIGVISKNYNLLKQTYYEIKEQEEQSIIESTIRPNIFETDSCIYYFVHLSDSARGKRFDQIFLVDYPFFTYEEICVLKTLLLNTMIPEELKKYFLIQNYS